MLHLVERGLDSVEVGPGAAPGGGDRSFDLDTAAHVERQTQGIGAAVRLSGEWQMHCSGRGRFQDESATNDARFQHPERLKVTDALSSAGTSNAERLHPLSFGTEAISRPEPCGLDVTRERVRDLSHATERREGSHRRGFVL